MYYHWASPPQAVLALDFHPSVSVLASGSRDCTIKFFDYSKPAAKRSYRALREVAGVRSLVFHPSGDFMLVGTEQCTCESFSTPPSRLTLRPYPTLFPIHILPYSPPISCSIPRPYSPPISCPIPCLYPALFPTHILPYPHLFAVRLYDVNTFQCFVSSDSRDQHGGAITSVG